MQHTVLVLTSIDIHSLTKIISVFLKFFIYVPSVQIFLKEVYIHWLGCCTYLQIQF